MTHWQREGQSWCARADDAEQMRALGADLGAQLRSGDLVVLDGPLGAGKTTLTQGIGRALAVRGAVTSPTFVIARSHPGPGPDLVHVDAYRLGSSVEVDDLGLDADLDDAVTVVEWGAGKVEGLAEERLEVHISREAGERGAGEREAGGREAGEREAGEREAWGRETGEREAGEREAGERVAGGRQAGESAGDRGDGERGAGETDDPAGGSRSVRVVGVGLRWEALILPVE